MQARSSHITLSLCLHQLQTAQNRTLSETVFAPKLSSSKQRPRALHRDLKSLKNYCEYSRSVQAVGTGRDPSGSLTQGGAGRAQSEGEDQTPHSLGFKLAMQGRKEHKYFFVPTQLTKGQYLERELIWTAPIWISACKSHA